MPYDASRDPCVFGENADAPARGLFVVEPSDAADLPIYAKALKCNKDGEICVLAVDNYRRNQLTPVKLIVGAGEIVPVQVARVFATGTTLSTAGDIVALVQ